MDWAARFIESIYSGINVNVYMRYDNNNAFPLVLGRDAISTICELTGLSAVYDEINKTVRFVR